MLRRCLLLVALLLIGCAPATPSASPSAVPPAATIAAAARPSTPEPSTTGAPATPSPSPPLWRDATAETIGTTAEWTNGVELADVNGDGLVDILFANGPYEDRDTDEPGPPQPTRVFLNQGPGKPFQDATERLLGPTKNLARVVTVRDLNGDGRPDILIGQIFQRQPRLFLGTEGGFAEVTATHLPQQSLSVGDLQIGDVNGDGALDVVLVDWGAPRVAGGRTRLWLNDGTGHFTDATATHMPDVKVGLSWEVELVDVDNDYDLDLAIACRLCGGSYLFLNDGTGHFANHSERLPQYGNNFAFEPIDLDGDGSFDLLTLDDGPSSTNHVFINDGHGSFKVGNPDFWPDSENTGSDDNVVVVLDADSDGHPDFLVGSFGGSDRLMVNDGHGRLSTRPGVFGGGATSGPTIGMAVADLNGDGRLDVVRGSLSQTDRVSFGDALPRDTAAPIVTLVEQAPAGPTLKVRARAHDNKTPVMPHDFKAVVLRVSVNGVAQPDVPMAWYGGALWRVEMPRPKGEVSYQVCATDAAGNAACAGPAGG